MRSKSLPADPCTLSAQELARLYREKRLSPVDAVAACLERVARYNPTLNAFVLLNAEAALQAAAQAAAGFARGDAMPPLAGIPVSVKDNIETAGLRSTMGSPLFRDYVPEQDSGVAAALRRSGAIILGKTNTSAFGWAGVTDNLLFGPTRNPWNPALTPGGSSGGAAVATATGMVPISLGTDGGGSLRAPAAFTGMIGFKPSHGRLPDSPAHPHWLIQHYGPVARTVADVALFLDAVAGPDPADPHSLPRYNGSYLADLQNPPEKPRVLFTTQLGWTFDVETEITAACQAIVTELAQSGWAVEQRDLAWSDPAPFANVIQMEGFRQRLAPFMDRTDEIEDGLRAMVETAQALPPHAFYDAYLARNRWCEQPARLFEDIDLLITPTTATLPFEIGRWAPATINGREIPRGGASPFLRAFNLSGNPAISMPIAQTANGLPIGLQIVGPRHADALVLAAASVIEKLRPLKLWTPEAD